MKKKILRVTVALLALILLLEVAFVVYQQFGGAEETPIDTKPGDPTDTAQNDTVAGMVDDPTDSSTETVETAPEVDEEGMPIIPADPQSGRPPQSEGADTATKPTQSAPTQATKPNNSQSGPAQTTPPTQATQPAQTEATEETEPEDTHPSETGDSTDPSGDLEENELPRVPGSF